METLIRRLIEAARHFEDVVMDEFEEYEITCAIEGPCDVCTAGSDMGSAILDLEDYLDEWLEGLK